MPLLARAGHRILTMRASDRFLDRFGPRLDMSHMQEASHFEQDLLGSTEGIFPLAPAPGEMMAFFDLVSEGMATLSIDTNTLTEKTLDVEDYQTRQASTYCSNPTFMQNPRPDLLGTCPP